MYVVSVAGLWLITFLDAPECFIATTRRPPLIVSTCVFMFVVIQGQGSADKARHQSVLIRFKHALYLPQTRT